MYICVNAVISLYDTNPVQLERDMQAACSKNVWHMHGHAKFKLCVCLRVLSKLLSMNYWIIVNRHFEVISRT